jgi:hypothetical protein
VTSTADLQNEVREGHVRCWAYRSEENVPPADVRSWLKAHTREITAEVNARAGRVTGLVVFVP